MGTSHLNIILRDHFCMPITNCWLLDLVVQFCNGTPLHDVFPIISQLKDNYALAGVAKDLSVYPLTTDQTGNTLEVTVGSGTMETLTFTSPAMSQAEILNQIKNKGFSGVKVYLQDGRIVIETTDKGPKSTLTIGGNCDLEWAPIDQGAGYDISTRYYHGAYRIKVQPPIGTYINHIALDVPVGCYKIWARVCHGKNEETSKVMRVIEHCGECYTVDLLLPEVMNCAQDIIYPFMDKVANDYVQYIPEVNDRAVVMKAVALAANLGKEQILTELADRKQDAIDINRTDLAARVDEIIAIAQVLPTCL